MLLRALFGAPVRSRGRIGEVSEGTNDRTAKTVTPVWRQGIFLIKKVRSLIYEGGVLGRVSLLGLVNSGQFSTPAAGHRSRTGMTPQAVKAAPTTPGRPDLPREPSPARALAGHGASPRGDRSSLRSVRNVGEENETQLSQGLGQAERFIVVARRLPRRRPIGLREQAKHSSADDAISSEALS